METHGTLLNAAVAHAMPMLQRITDAEASTPLSPGKWCAKEVIGHLLDSANNNLGRIVRLQGTDHLLIEPYAQDAWVEAQGYATADWIELVELWSRINRHMARVMDRVPDGPLLRPRAAHRPLGQTFAPLPPHGLPTLEWLMQDYVEHLKHHLRQIGQTMVQ